MKRVKLEEVPEEVDKALFRTLAELTPSAEEAGDVFYAERFSAAHLRNLAREMELAGHGYVFRDDGGDRIVLSPFGVLNGIFMHYCPGYRLALANNTKAGPMRLYVCKEEP